MNKFQYSNADNNDLWESLSHSSGKDIVSLMDFWISTPGLPCVSIAYDEEDNILLLDQHQYKSEIVEGGNDAETSKKDPIWPIPLTIEYKTVSGRAEVFSTLFDKQNLIVQLPKGDPLHEFKINPSCKSFFIYAPDLKANKMLVEKLDFLVDREKRDYFNNLIYLVILFFFFLLTVNRARACSRITI